jgi:hypothetical protein
LADAYSRGLFQVEVGPHLINIIICAAIYFLPAIVANTRKAPHEISIFWVNFLLGWTVLGWFAVLIWTVAETDPQVIPESWSKSFLGRSVAHVIERVNSFAPDDKRKGRVRFL